MSSELEDYTEDDRWDWDRNDSSQYCQHGTFIGSWWGPDLLCQWCEDGVSVEDMRKILRDARIREALAEVNRACSLIHHLEAAKVNGELPYRASVATFLWNYLHELPSLMRAMQVLEAEGVDPYAA